MHYVQEFEVASEYGRRKRELLTRIALLFSFHRFEVWKTRVRYVCWLVQFEMPELN